LRASQRLTYDGERCLYAALNDDTRRVLLEEGFAFAAARSHGARALLRMRVWSHLDAA
jgi:hypothetical protein